MKAFIYLARRAAAPALIVLATAVSPARADHGFNLASQICVCQDLRNFDKGARVKVYINTNSFTDLGFPSTFTRRNLENAAQVAVDAWRQVGGLDLNLTYEGATGRTEPNDGEILIRAEQVLPILSRGVAVSSAFGEAILVGQGGTYGRSRIRLARLSINGTNMPWRMFEEAPNETNMVAVLIHEMGHSLGLQHNDGVLTVMHTTGSIGSQWGPFAEDVEDIQDLYGTPKIDVKSRSAFDTGGTSWSSASGVIVPRVTTTMPLTVIADNNRWIMFYTRRDKRAAWIRGTNVNAWDDAGTLFGTARSLYGIGAHGYDNEYMAAWVDMDNHQVRVVRSTDGGANWTFVNPSYTGSVSESFGTPALLKMGNSVWILAYTKRGKFSNDIADDGKVVYRITTNNGTSWGAETAVGLGGGRALRGVSLAAFGRSVRWAYTESNPTFSNSVMMVSSTLNSSNQLVFLNSVDGTLVRAYPDVSMAKTQLLTDNRFVIANRGPTASLVTRNATSDSLLLTGLTTVNSSAIPFGPALVIDRNKSSLFMFTLGE